MAVTQSEIQQKLLKLASRLNLKRWKSRLFEHDNLIARQKLKIEILMLKRKLSKIEENTKGA